MKKHIKKITIMGVALTMALGMIALTGCNTGVRSNLLFRVGNDVSVLLNVGETAELKFDELFKDYTLNTKRVEMTSSDKGVFTVRGNKIRSIGTGSAFAEATVFDEHMQQVIITVKVFVVNPSKMIKVKTAQDLANMGNDPSGAYILKNDIDLKNFGDWMPIANYSTEGKILSDFRGIFINPDGYKIKNMSIHSVGKIPTDSRSHDLGIGLFETLAGAYIDGLILENVSIDTSAYADRALSTGGVCGYSINSVIRNCSVSGSIVSQKAVGGITGTFSRGIILGCAFKGITENTLSTFFGGSGGIAGMGFETFKIIDCIVEAVISGELYAGGILGHYTGAPKFYDGVEESIVNSFFTGELEAPYTGEKYGLIGSP